MTLLRKQNTPSGVRSLRTGARLLALALPVAALGVLASGCGGSSGEGVAQDDSTQAATTSTGSSGSSKREALVAFSACMRRNGVPNFPDPEPSGGGTRLSLGSERGIDPNAPRFENARRICQRLLPTSNPQEQGEQLREALAYSGCMRRHGVPNYPDPKASGEGGIEWGELGPRVGIDPDSPHFKAAERACKELAPGANEGDAAPRPGTGPRQQKGP